MSKRSLLMPAAAGALSLVALLPVEAVALPGGVDADRTSQAELVQPVGHKYSRRYYRDHGTYVRAPFAEVDTRRGTWVAAPFARVYSGRDGTWVRAPFVDLFVPR
jgi:hypothetical protein